MIRLGSAEYNDVLDIVYTANRCGDMECLISTLCPTISRMFHADVVTFQLVSGSAPDINIVESRSFQADKNILSEDRYYPVLYKEGYYHHSPLLKGAISTVENVLKIGNYISFRDWERSFFYNSFILPQHLYWELFLALRWRHNLEGMITLWRSDKQIDYSDSDISKAELLAPHLMVAVHNINLVNSLTRWKKYFSGEGSSEGILCLDHKFKPVYFNTRAKDICLRLLNGHCPEDIKPEDEFPIPAQILSDCRELQDIYEIKEQPAILPKETIIHTENGAKFRLETSMVWKTDKMNTLPNFIVVLLDLAREEKIDQSLQAKFSLSKRELDVVYYLTSGLSYDEIADKLFISKQTVHTHTKNIYRKIGARNRIDLYRNIRLNI